MPAPGETALAALPGLGKTSARMLTEAGVRDVETLCALGPIEAYRRLKFHHGRRVTLNFAYALDCAILGIHWRALGADRKAQIRAAARAAESGLAAASRMRAR